MRSISNFIYRMLCFRLRFAVTGWLMLALLLPSLFGFVSLGSNTSAACGMSCCKQTKSGCCRHTQNHGPGWKGSTSCSKDCGVRPCAGGEDVAANAEANVESAFPSPRALHLSRSESVDEHKTTDFTLFQRPPPSLF